MIGKKDKAEKKEPEVNVAPAVPVPSRGRLLNQWAARQEKLGKLQEELRKVKVELTEVAQALHSYYGVLVQDTTHTVILAPRQTGQERAPEAEQGVSSVATVGEDGEPTELLRPEDNPLARSPIPIQASPHVTQPVSSEVEQIRKDAALEKGADPGQFGQDIATSLDRAVRIGLGKPPGKVGPR